MAGGALDEFVRNKLKERTYTQSLRLIALATGIKEPWIQAYGTGKIKNPPVDRVEKLFEYFTGKPLELKV